MIPLLELLFPPRVDEVTLRGIATEEFLSLVRPTLVLETRPETISLLSFGVPAVRAAIHEAKYHGNSRAFKLLGLALADYLRDTDGPRGLRESVIIPLPLGKKRRRERGFNQIDEVARAALQSLGAGHAYRIDSSLLLRTRETASQVSLPRREREKNMRGAFTAERADPTATYFIIDDVITTGATLQAAIDALEEAGATQIIPLALAH